MKEKTDQSSWYANIRRSFRTLSLFLSLLFVGVSIALIWQRTAQKKASLHHAQHIAATTTQQAAQQLQLFLTNLKTIAQKLADEISTQHLLPEQLLERLQQKPAAIAGLGIAFQPSMSPTKNPWGYYYYEKDGKQTLTELKPTYWQEPWFSTYVTKQAGYIRPESPLLNNDILVEYSAPIYSTDAQGTRAPIGVVFADQTRDHINHVLNTLFLGENGYWFITDTNGKLLSYPAQTDLPNNATLKDLAHASDASALNTLTEQFAVAPSGSVTYTNELTRRPSWLFFEQLAAQDLVLCGVFDQRELSRNITQEKHDAILLSLALMAALCFFLVWYIMYKEQSIVMLWLISFCIAGTLAAEIGALWKIAADYTTKESPVDTIKNKVDLYTFLEKVATRDTTDKRTPQKENTAPSSSLDHLTYRYKKGSVIPTGIFINYLNFLDAHQLEASFLLWQRYATKQHADIQPGFLLPQATDITITQLYSTEKDNTKIIVWQVKCVLNQQFSYTDYPFDSKAIEIQIWPKEFAKDVLLVPDLDAYQLLNPHALPGLSQETRTITFIPEKSFFNFKTTPYATNFGIYGYGPFGKYQQMNTAKRPTLYFTVIAQRRLIDTLIADLLPVAVIACLLFIILVTSVLQGYALFGSCASIFFGLVFAHLRVRAKIPSDEIVYFENIYFILYAALLYVLIVAALYMLPISLSVIQRRKNLIAKLLYWPLVLGSILAITLAYLY